VPLAMRTASQGLNDHKRIAWSKQPWTRFRPAEALLLHSRSRMFLQTALKSEHAGQTVVITHHAPHPRCCIRSMRTICSRRLTSVTRKI
jgi:hypothetical protein